MRIARCNLSTASTTERGFMARIEFSVEVEIAKMDKSKKQTNRDVPMHAQPKIQRFGPGYFEFYLQNPVH